MLDLLRRGWPVTFELTAALPAPPPVVWDLVTDWEHLDEWMLEASDFRVTSPYREGVGVEAEATIAIAGIRVRDRVRISGWEKGSYLAIEHLGWVGGTGEMQLTEVDETSTFLVWRETLRPPLGAAGGVGLSLLKPVMLGIFRRDLGVLTALARMRSRA